MSDRTLVIEVEDGRPEDAPRDAAYNCWTPAAIPDLAVNRFAAQYGQYPAYMFMHKGLLWLGPVPARDGEDAMG